MPVHNLSTSLTRLQKQSFSFIVLDRDGNVDTTSTVTAATTNATIATIAVDASDNRLAWITAHSPGACTVNVAKGTSAISIATTVTDIDLSDVQLGAFNPPVAQ